MKEKIYWHKILQEILEDNDNLKELSGKIITGKAREHHQMTRADFICHTDGDIKPAKDIIRPLDHFKFRNILEYKSFHEVINEKAFRRYVGRALDAETCDDVDYQGKTTLTIITTHKPKKLFAINEYKIERINKWKYQSFWIKDLSVYILVQSEMRDVKAGESLALLQIVESEKEKQVQVWENLFDQDLDNIEKLKSIVEKISGGKFMNLVQEIKKEGHKEGHKEGQIEIAIEMLKDKMSISQIAKFTKLTEIEIMKLKEKLQV